MSKTCILIIGNHRSGTSVLTGCLHLCDIDLGINRDLSKNQHNEKGFFENLSILSFNEKVLLTINSSWKDINPVMTTQDHKILQFTEELCDIIKREYTEPIFMIKDPRIIFLYPVYINALQRMNISFKIIYADRNFNEICKSLEKVHRLRYEHSYALCEKYKSRGHHFMEQYPNYISSYNDLLSDPIKEITNVLSFLDIPINIESEKIINFVDQKLKHF